MKTRRRYLQTISTHLAVYILGTVFALQFSSIYGCSPNQETKLKFDSADSIALNAHVRQGIIITQNVTTEQILNRQIEDQLKFSIGQLNAFNAVASLSTLRAKILEKRPLSVTETEVYYSADFIVSWAKELEPPQSMILLLPQKADANSLEQFFKVYGDRTSIDHNCMEAESEEAVASTFWYYFRPLIWSCVLQEIEKEHELIFKTTMDFYPSSENTVGKYPEYEKVWEDNQLVVTAIFGKGKVGATDVNIDPGIFYYRQFYFGLLSLFGAPQISSLKEGEVPDNMNNNVSLKFLNRDGIIDIQMFLVDSIAEMTPEMKSQYNLRTTKSDYVSYSGHSGYGENIRQLVKLGRFEKGQYQIFLINGCDTFAYVDHSLKEAHASINPGYSEYKFVDVITNAMPAKFKSNDANNLVLIKSLTEQKLSYREILDLFPIDQRAAVVGEEDNRWPLPFYE